ncbi:MAG: hypothetical protein AAGE18_19215 [Pseudomonadota bacterium]
MRWFITLSLILGSVVLSPASFGQGVEPIKLGEDADFGETLHPNAQISGGHLIGLVAGNVLATAAEVAAEAPLIEVNVPSGWQGEVCISMLSADGLYEARNQYTLDAGQTGARVPVAYEGEHDDLLSALEPVEIGVLLAQGGCGTGPATTYAPAFWRGQGIEGDQVSLLINSRRAEQAFLFVDQQPVACRALEHENRTAYDMACVVDAAALGAGPKDVQLWSYRNGQAQPPVPLTVEIGDLAASR